MMYDNEYEYGRGDGTSLTRDRQTTFGTLNSSFPEAEIGGRLHSCIVILRS